LREFERALEAWFQSHGYERSDWNNPDRHRYIFVRPDRKNRHMVVNLWRRQENGPQNGYVEIRERVPRWRWQRREPLMPTQEERDLAKELADWLRASNYGVARAVKPP
jgi:hypothetical protein